MRSRTSLNGLKPNALKNLGLIVAAVAFSLSLAARASTVNSCVDAVNAKVLNGYSLDDLKKPYKHFEHDPERYALSGKRLDEVRNQCAYGSCWAYSTLSVYEQRAKSRGVNIRLSEDFLIVSQLREQAKQALSTRSFQYVQQGFRVSDAESLLMENGLVPFSAWQSKIKFSENKNVGARFVFNLNVLITHLKEALGENAGKKARQQAMEKVDEYLASMMGPLPKTFVYNGNTYDPKSFLEEPMFKEIYSDGFVDLKVSQDPLKVFKSIKDQLDRTGEPVRLAIKWTDTFVDHETGVVSLEAFNPFGSSPSYLSDLALQTSDAVLGSHAVDIVDYDVKPDGTPVKLLVLNSWGKEKGDGGYYHIYWDYFKERAQSIRVYRVFGP